MDEQSFYQFFPRTFYVRALNKYEAERRGFLGKKTYWEYHEEFIFNSKVWGPIVVPSGFVTDFASVPKFLHGIYDDDCPILLFPSAPHDFLFLERQDGTRGWLSDGRQLSLHECNLVLIEAMEVCGASALDRANVLAAVEIANQPLKRTFRSSP